MPVTILPDQKWDFVADHELRKILARDYRELRKLLKVHAYKSALVMCGSIIEAVLVAVLSEDPALKASAQAKYTELFKKAAPPLDNWELHQLIRVSAALGRLKEDAAFQADLLRNYRNLIHPMVEHRKEIDVEPELVNVVRFQLTKILGWLSRTRIKKSPRGPRVIRLLEAVGRIDEAQVARKIYEWAMDNSLDFYETKVITYIPRLNYQGVIHMPIAVRRDGKVQVQFGRLKKRSPFFRSDDSRRELRNRLNDIPGIRISADDIDKFPPIALAALKDEERFSKFRETLNWIVQKIRGP